LLIILRLRLSSHSHRLLDINHLSSWLNPAAADLVHGRGRGPQAVVVLANADDVKQDESDKDEDVLEDAVGDAHAVFVVDCRVVGENPDRGVNHGVEFADQLQDDGY